MWKDAVYIAASFKAGNKKSINHPENDILKHINPRNKGNHKFAS